MEWVLKAELFGHLLHEHLRPVQKLGGQVHLESQQ